jgi:hypothetical protein
MWYLWSTLAAFNEWHEAAKLELGLPRPGVNQATGEVDQDAEWTLVCAAGVETENGVVAFLSDDVAAAAPDFLGTPTNSPYPPTEMTE